MPYWMSNGFLLWMRDKPSFTLTELLYETSWFSCYLNRFEAILLATHWKRLGFGYAGIIYGFFLNLKSGVCFDATKTNIPVYLIHLPNKIQINREISSNLMTSKFLSSIHPHFVESKFIHQCTWENMNINKEKVTTIMNINKHKIAMIFIMSRA